MPPADREISNKLELIGGEVAQAPSEGTGIQFFWKGGQATEVAEGAGLLTVRGRVPPPVRACAASLHHGGRERISHILSATLPWSPNGPGASSCLVTSFHQFP